MTSILIIEKSGSIKSLKAKDLTFDNLYKKAGFKSPEGFKSHTNWNVSIGQDSYRIGVYGKTAGKAGQENKYDFPPPIDSTLFFGSCVLINTDADNRILDLTEAAWTKIYEHLFGGFEDLGSEDGDEDELDTDEELETLKQSGQIVQQTKHGYVKDGFIVDSDEAEDSDYVESEEEIERKPAKKVIQKTIKVQITKKATKKKTKAAEPEPEEADNTYLDCTSELKEEEYV
jgi:hypothetical protein